MLRLCLLALALLCSLSSVPLNARAEAPRVAADILPVHALVARVMQGVGAPELVLPPGASPHDFALRPSQAAALQNADLVFWVGEALTPWFARALDALADDAEAVALLTAPGVTHLAIRSGTTFAEHSHDDGHKRDDGHGHSEHTDAAPAHDDTAHDHAAHDHGGLDPHVWLDPENGKAWLSAIAETLSAHDPANAATYAANAAAGRAELDALTRDVAATLAPVRGVPYLVLHDAYHYFEARFAIEALGAIALSDASDPGAARLATLRAAVRDEGVRCVFAEPQIASALVETVIEDTNASTGTLDPLGTQLTPGPTLYPALLRDLAASLRNCLAAN